MFLDYILLRNNFVLWDYGSGIQKDPWINFESCYTANANVNAFAIVASVPIYEIWYVQSNASNNQNVSSGRVSWVHLSSDIVFYIYKIHLLNEMIALYLLHTKNIETFVRYINDERFQSHFRSVCVYLFLFCMRNNETNEKKLKHIAND